MPGGRCPDIAPSPVIDPDAGQIRLGTRHDLTALPHQHERRVMGEEPAEIGREEQALLDTDRPEKVSAGEVGPRSQIDHPGRGLRHRGEANRVEDLGRGGGPAPQRPGCSGWPYRR